MSKQSFLTVENLIYLGLYDDTYILYEKIKDIFEDALDTHIEKFGTKNFYLHAEEKKHCRKKASILVKNWLNENKDLFVDKDIVFDKTARYIGRDLVYKFAEKADENKIIWVTVRFIRMQEFLSWLEKCVIDNTWEALVKMKRGKGRDELSEEIEHRVNRKANLILGDSFVGKPLEQVIQPGDVGDCVLIVYRRLDAISCNRKQHSVIPGICCRELLNDTGTIRIPVHQCKTCGKVFIGKATLDLYIKEYGRFLGEIREEACDTGIGFEQFKNESKLHALGYNVVEGEWTERERQALLLTLLKTEKITYFQMCRDIERAINLFEGSYRMQAAVKKWKSDLKYIGNYML